MKTTFDVLDIIYKQLNHSTVTSVINGSIYRRKKPEDRKKQDVVITPLVLRNDVEIDIQDGTLFINIFCPNLDSGLPDETKLKQILDAVVTRMEAYTSATNYYRFRIISESTFQDTVDMSYIGLRTVYYLEI